MDDLTAFISARLDEDEAAAKAWLPLGNPTAAQREHIASVDPARVLREVAAMRQVVLALYATGRPTTMSELPSPTAGLARLALRHLAAVWSDHPDYQQGWAS